MVAVTSWGRLNHYQHDVKMLVDESITLLQIKEQHSNIQSMHNPLGLAYGMGRSYGDVCLNPNGILWDTTNLDKFINFDEQTGCLTCQSGVLLRDIQRIFMPRGWALPVTPGTQFVTVGGAIANDVHGKNHHVAGSFGDHVKKINICRTDGSKLTCGPDILPEWFTATIGGLGLTGVITSAEIQLKPVQSEWLLSETIPYSNLKEFCDLADKSETQWEHTVAWIDCLSKTGRGLFMRANSTNKKPNHQTKNKKHTVPFTPPISLVNQFTLKPFNATYYALKKNQASATLTHYQSFFYPLDNLLEWNRMYGPKGFYQYQSVVPLQNGIDAVQAMLDVISKSGQGSFLAVLKTFGNRQPLGMLSFPQPGLTLALDFPNRGIMTAKLFNQLDAIVSQ